MRYGGIAGDDQIQTGHKSGSIDEGIVRIHLGREIDHRGGRAKRSQLFGAITLLQ